MLEKIKKSPSKTAEEVTIIRIIESTKPEDERICYDPLAVHFIGSKTLELLQKKPEIDKEKQVVFKGVANTIAARVRYFDDFVKKSIDDGIEQLVILGAGYDTRAYRIEGLKENVKVFELDYPSTQNLKIEKIKEIFGYLPSHVTYASIDLEKESLDEKLFKNKYDPLKKTLFIMEGLTMYISPETVDEILSFIVENSSRGSAVIFDYASRTVNFDEHSDRKTVENLTDLMEKSNESMKFSLMEGTAEEFLSMMGFSDVIDVTCEDYKKAYFYGKNKDREVFSLMSFVHAVVG
ncbi:SAM-dependent methyltransferase [Methanobacterium sp.]|uniref:SAM-dependent methyltransferase n=1 Tax=Methanobacterium sp. TaxID=2164 RepID=UPI003C76C2DA